LTYAAAYTTSLLKNAKLFGKRSRGPLDKTTSKIISRPSRKYIQNIKRFTPRYCKMFSEEWILHIKISLAEERAIHGSKAGVIILPSPTPRWIESRAHFPG